MEVQHRSEKDLIMNTAQMRDAAVLDSFCHTPSVLLTAEVIEGAANNAIAEHEQKKKTAQADQIPTINQENEEPQCKKARNNTTQARPIPVTPSQFSDNGSDFTPELSSESDPNYEVYLSQKQEIEHKEFWTPKQLPERVQRPPQPPRPFIINLVVHWTLRQTHRNGYTLCITMLTVQKRMGLHISQGGSDPSTPTYTPEFAEEGGQMAHRCKCLINLLLKAKRLITESQDALDVVELNLKHHEKFDEDMACEDVARRSSLLTMSSQFGLSQSSYLGVSSSADQDEFSAQDLIILVDQLTQHHVMQLMESSEAIKAAMESLRSGMIQNPQWTKDHQMELNFACRLQLYNGLHIEFDNDALKGDALAYLKAHQAINGLEGYFSIGFSIGSACHKLLKQAIGR
ncbi:hypothetical protein C8J57DRAFT_1250769 [Mycena rebaudengoi]|nr:hypothetical protein C8J57DRAFT_1250769 [Mycena rebaudengoi]